MKLCKRETDCKRQMVSIQGGNEEHSSYLVLLYVKMNEKEGNKSLNIHSDTVLGKERDHDIMRDWEEEREGEGSVGMPKKNKERRDELCIEEGRGERKEKKRSQGSWGCWNQELLEQKKESGRIQKRKDAKLKMGMDSCRVRKGKETVKKIDRNAEERDCGC